MNYRKALTIPANTPASSPVAAGLSLPEGVIRLIRIYFPAGCCGLAHIRIMVTETQQWPSNLGEWFAGEDSEIEFEEAYRLTEAWNWVEIEGYNEDDTHDHTVTVQFAVEAAAAVGEYPRLGQFLDALRGY